MPNKRKVLFVLDDLGKGGAEKVLSTLVHNLDKNRFDITVCALTGGETYENTIEKDAEYRVVLKSYSNYGVLGRWLYSIMYHLVYYWLPLSLVYRLFIPKGNDVEVAFVEGFATKLMAASSNRKAKKIAWVHIDLHKFHWTRGIFKNNLEESSAYNCYNQIITVSKTAEAAIREEFFLSTPVKTVYNPIDADEILRLAQDSVEIEQQNRMRIVSVGRLNKQKAYDRLLRVICRLKNEGKNCELWLLGEGPDRPTLENYVEEQKLEDSVRLFGFQPNPYKYLSHCDLFVCSSISEGFSTAITESLILGLPVVSTEVSGVREQLTNGCGIITENNEDALYQGLKSVLDHPEMLADMKAKALDRGKEFRIESLMKEIENVLS